jgi:hypothetical protein
MDRYRLDYSKKAQTSLIEIISTVYHGSCGTASFGHAAENNPAGHIYAARQRYVFVSHYLPD